LRIKILADSTCDLSDELLEHYDIRRVPLGIVIGDEILKDGIEVTPFDIFDYVSSGKGICKTTAINVAEYLEAFQEEFDKGAEAILNFTISAELSSCYENSLIAARDFSNVFSVDTRSLSTGGGWLVVYAAELVAQGLDAKSIAEACEKKKHLSDSSFVIDTLDYLHKGGRCSGLAAYAAGVLNLKPCLNLINGKIEVGKKYHGNIKKTIRKYIEDRIAGRTDLDLSCVFITHTMFDDPQYVAEIIDLVKSLQPFEKIYETSAGCTISNHCGPNTLGILLYSSE